VINLGLCGEMIFQLQRFAIRPDGSARNMLKEKMIIYPELFSALIRTVLFLDPSGAGGVHNIMTVRILYTAHITVGVMSSYVLLFLWLDFVIGMKSAFAHKYKTSLFSHNIVRSILYVLFAIIIVGDVFVNVLGSFGILGLAFVSLPSIFYISLNLIRSIFCLTISCNLHLIVRQVKHTQQSATTMRSNNSENKLQLKQSDEKSKPSDDKKGSNVVAPAPTEETTDKDKKAHDERALLNDALVKKVTSTSYYLIAIAVSTFISSGFGAVVGITQICYTSPLLFVVFYIGTINIHFCVYKEPSLSTVHSCLNDG
jgi:hypothetical protein